MENILRNCGIIIFFTIINITMACTSTPSTNASPVDTESAINKNTNTSVKTTDIGYKTLDQAI